MVQPNRSPKNRRIIEGRTLSDSSRTANRATERPPHFRASHRGTGGLESPDLKRFLQHSWRRLRRRRLRATAPVSAILAALVLVPAAPSPAAESTAAPDPGAASRDFGPFLQDIRLTLEPGDGVEAAGPFYFSHETPEEERWGLPPLVTATTSADGERAQWFVLPPIFSWRKYNQDHRWQVLQLISGGGLDKIDEPGVKRFSVFPFVFYQDSPDPAHDFWALFPLYGTVRNRLFRDEIDIVAFPLWMKSRKGTTTTHNVAFPIFHWREGVGLKGWQAWPLVGHEHLDPGTRVNLAGDQELVPGHDKTFALWPFWFRNRLGLGSSNVVRVDATIPLYYVERSPLRDHTEIGFPFFSWTDDRGQKYRQWNVPWPFVSFARGEGKTLDRVLPLFSVGHTATYDSQLYLWPAYRRRHTKTQYYDRERWQIGVVLYAELTEGNPQTGQYLHRKDSWPLFSWSRDKDGKERLQALALIEPMRRGLGVERNWSPVWSLWRQERDTKSGAEMQSLLWNLYRRESADGTTKGSLLFGLVQYEKSPAGRRWRWFHLGPRLASPGAAAPAGSEARSPAKTPSHPGEK